MTNVQQKQRNSRVQKYLSLVQPIAKRYAQRSGCDCDCDDLIQVGCLGLIQASQRFQHTKGTLFHVFAKPHIRGAILHYLRDNASLIRFRDMLKSEHYFLETRMSKHSALLIV